MPKTRAEKERIVEELTEKVKGSQSMVLADYRGLTVDEVTVLRRKLRDQGVEFKVVKNTLAAIVAAKLGLEGLEKHLEGPTAVAFSEDPVAPARSLVDFVKESKKAEIKAGILDGKVIDIEAVKALAQLPPREELLAKALGGMQAPLYGFASVIQVPLRGFVYAVESLRRQREAG